METKAPVGHHDWRANNLAILLSNLNRTWAGEEIKVHNAAKSVVFKILPGLRCVVDFEIYAVAVEEKDTMGFIAARTVLKVDWMVPV